MDFFEFSPELETLSAKALKLCTDSFAELDEIYEYNSKKVLKAFIDNRVSEANLKGTTGYGYDDGGRDKLDAVFAQILGAEDSLVRHTLVNGTHAIVTALFGVLRTGDRIVSLTGEPYDTLNDAISGKGMGSLADFGIEFDKLDLLDDGTIDLAGIPTAVKGAKVAYLQRSRGYSLRPSYTISALEKAISAAKAANPDVIVMVDNCYGELCERVEPTAVGADLIIGSLIKNLGGGIAETGGYIAGKRELIELCAYRNTTPGAGKEVGCTLNQLRGMYMGLFNSPNAVLGAVKTSVFASALFGLCGFKCYPECGEKRTDIIAAIALGSRERLIAFCKGIQSGSPIDSFVSPEPWAMPGYDSEVIMAAGAFTMGASIELSADGPLREPYAVYIQGGLSFETGKIGVLKAAQAMLEQGVLYA